MKKFAKLIALAVLMIMGGQAMAQTRGAMFLGASIPMKDFAVFDGFNEFALTSSDVDADDAGAAIGFNVGFKWYFNVGVEGLGVMLSVDGIYNGPKSELKDAYRDREISLGNQNLGGSFTYRATPKFINVPAMLGLNYIYHFNPNLGLFVEAGAGGNLCFITMMETLTKAQGGTFEIKTLDTQYYDKAFTFAYQAGIGLEVAKNLVIGCSFYDLGKSEVKGVENIKITTGDNVNTEKFNNAFGTIHPYIIMARIGFSF